MTQRSPVMYDPRDEAALRRINYFKGDWDRLNWYVQLMAKRLDGLSAGELLMLQEEFAALERTLRGNDKSVKPSLEAMKGFQTSVKRYVECLVDDDKTTLGPFLVSIEVYVPLAAAERGERNKDWISQRFGPVDRKTSTLPRITSRETVKGMEPCLLYHLAKLLEQLGASIKRCNHCLSIFVQSRRHAAYCGRQCQSVAAMREVRRKRKERQPKRLTTRKKGV
ncbi:MAG: hypothetical protein L0H94_04355 [Nitrospira sp.]|nr:hypothetical protein [Nitrospira sp.]